MNVKVFTDYEELSEAVATIVVDLIKRTPNAVICFASGHTPLLACQLFVAKILREKIDVSAIRFFSLDEWVGVPPENQGSCHHFFYDVIFNPLGLTKNQVYVFDALTNNEADECKKMDEAIAAAGGLDLMVVGIGMNGHIGFNEPGVAFDNYSHVMALDKSTIEGGQKYFETNTILSKGITIGLQHLIETKQVIMIANGDKKAEIIKRTFDETVNEQLPATIMKTHKNGTIMLDKAAASLLSANQFDASH